MRAARAWVLVGVVGAAALAACASDDSSGFHGDDGGGAPDGDGIDAQGADGASHDGGHDATSDAAPDAGADAAAHDSGADASGDAGADASDAGPDAPGDAAGEAAAEAGSDGGADAPADAPGEAATDAAGEAGADASGDAAADADSGPMLPPPPMCDGVITAGEYGVHTNGQNQETAGNGTIWYMTYDATSLYVGIASANIAEAAVLYVGTRPSVSADAGTPADGTTAGFTYDSTRALSLPTHAALVAYIKSSYNEYRLADGANGWQAQHANALTVCSSGTTREFSIPWTLVGGHPSAYDWLGYVTSGGGFVYGQMPPGNPGGNVGTSAVFPWLYVIGDATPGTGDKPFAMPLMP